MVSGDRVCLKTQNYGPINYLMGIDSCQEIDGNQEPYFWCIPSYRWFIGGVTMTYEWHTGTLSGTYSSQTCSLNYHSVPKSYIVQHFGILYSQTHSFTWISTDIHIDTQTHIWFMLFDHPLESTSSKLPSFGITACTKSTFTFSALRFDWT